MIIVLTDTKQEHHIESSTETIKNLNIRNQSWINIHRNEIYNSLPKHTPMPFLRN